MYQETTRSYVRTYQEEPRIVYTEPDLSGIYLDLDYLKTFAGMLKCIQICVCFMCLISVSTGQAYYSGASWASFVSLMGLMLTTLLLILYLFHIVDKISAINVTVTEMAYCFAWAMFFFLSGTVLILASLQYKLSIGWTIGSFFAFAGMIAYGLDSWLKFLAWKRGEKAMGGGEAERVTV
uniref:MARVEL domain-containing protein n=1 Tax=Rhabditophanes sp. KR3021 TaxID=114890 RepID=A0AC35TV59_9BILA